MAVKNSTSRRNALWARHSNLVRHIAEGVKAVLPPSFSLEDLVQEGMIGLLRAATQYKPAAHRQPGFARVVPFPCFARKFIRGAILDSVRRRRWTDNTCLPLDTGDSLGDAILPACAPTQGHQAHRLDLLRQITRASVWLTSEQRSILAMRYGTGEMTMPAIAAAMDQSVTWVWDRHNEAIGELRFRTGARMGAARRLVAVPPKKTNANVTSVASAAATAAETERRKKFDELGELDLFFAPLKSKLARQKSLREWSRGLYDDADAARAFEVSGDRFTVLIGARSNKSTVDIPGLIKKIGIKLFGSIATVTLEALAEKVSAEVTADVVTVAQTGFRSVTTFERSPVLPKAA